MNKHLEFERIMALWELREELDTVLYAAYFRAPKGSFAEDHAKKVILKFRAILNGDLKDLNKLGE